MQKVLLTGAAGAVGYEVLKQLIASKKYSIYVLELPTKKSHKRLKQYESVVDVVYGSINDYKLVKALISKVDVVIHLAAVIPPLADREPELTRQVNFFGTQNIVKAIRESNNKPFLFYSSSVSVYGDRVSDYWITVLDDLKPSIGDYYATTKIETEKMITDSSIDYSIFRLTGIMGHPKTDPLMFHMPLDTKLEIATIPDTARAFVHALEHKKELNHKIFNLGGGPNCRTTYREFMMTMFKVYGLNWKHMKDIFFAEQNFHCGYYKDGDDLENILHFQQDTLDTYYQRVKKETKGIVSFFSKMFSRPIIYTLAKKSDPYQAKKQNKISLIERFYKKK